MAQDVFPCILLHRCLFDLGVGGLCLAPQGRSMQGVMEDPNSCQGVEAHEKGALDMALERCGGLLHMACIVRDSHHQGRGVGSACQVMWGPKDVLGTLAQGS